MGRSFRRTSSIILLALLLSILPITALAADYSAELSALHFDIVNIPLHIFLKNLNDVVYWNNSPWSVAEWGFIPIRRRVYAIWGTEA